MKSANLFLSILIIACQAGNCQQNFNWEKYHQHFKEDSAESFQNTLSGFEKVASIRQSGNEIEFRFRMGNVCDTDAVLYQFTYNDGKIDRFVYFRSFDMNNEHLLHLI